MVDYTLTPNMGIKNPIPTETLGPTYAQYVSDGIDTIDGHGHTGNGTDGIQITSAALNINEDVSWASNNINNLRTVRFTNLTSVPAGTSDVACAFFVDGNFYINSGSGDTVQITDGSQIDNTSGNTTYSLQELAGNLTIGATDTYVLVNTDTNAARTITLPVANSVAAGRYYIIIDQTGLAQTNPITINKSGADTIDGATSYVVRANFGAVVLISNAVNQWNAVSYFNTRVGNLTTGTTPARSGAISMSNNSAIKARNAADSTDVNLLSISSSNNLAIGDGSNNGTVVVNAGLAAFVKLQVNNSDRLNVAGASMDSIVSTFNWYDTGGTLALTANLNGAGASNLTWASATTPTLTQTTNTTGSATGKLLTISAQTCSGTTSTGGSLTIGTGSGTSNPGTLTFKLGSTITSQISPSTINHLTYTGFTLLAHAVSSNTISLGDAGDIDVMRIGGIEMNINSTTLGFYGQTPVAQQTGVAVNATAIHTALVNLGLITA